MFPKIRPVKTLGAFAQLKFLNIEARTEDKEPYHFVVTKPLTVTSRGILKIHICNNDSYYYTQKRGGMGQPNVKIEIVAAATYKPSKKVYLL